jgi:hypothetical protein
MRIAICHWFICKVEESTFRKYFKNLNHCHRNELASVYNIIYTTAILIIIKVRFHVLERFSSSKLVRKTVESCFVALNYYENGSTIIQKCEEESIVANMCVHTYAHVCICIYNISRIWIIVTVTSWLAGPLCPHRRWAIFGDMRILWARLPMYVCVCMYVYVCMYVCMCVCMRSCMAGWSALPAQVSYLWWDVNLVSQTADVCVCVYVCMCVCMCVCMRSCMAYVCVYVCVHVWHKLSGMLQHAYTYTYKYTYVPIHVKMLLYTYKYTSPYKYTYAYKYTYVPVHVKILFHGRGSRPTFLNVAIFLGAP